MCLDLWELAIFDGRIARLFNPGSQRRRVSSGKKYKSDINIRRVQNSVGYIAAAVDPVLNENTAEITTTDKM